MTTVEYEKKHNVFEPLCAAFEDCGGCGHDLGYAVFLIIQAWEKVRTEEKVRDLMLIGEPR